MLRDNNMFSKNRIRMNKIIGVLSTIAIATLALAIARQLSENNKY
jgi:hypothetical protein